MRLHLVRVIVLAVVSLGLAACGGSGGGGHKQPPVPASITIASGNSQTGVAGSALPAVLNVSVKDSSGRAVAGASVSWAVVAGGGSVTPTTSTTDSAGIATTNWTLGAALGANRVSATVGTLPAVAFDATGVAGPAASVSIVAGNGQSGSVGTELPAALTVRVTDSGARPVSGATVTWAVTSGGGTVTPTTATTDSSGTANTRWTLGATAGTNRVTAMVTGLPGVTFDATGSAAGPMVETYEDSGVLYFESRMGDDVARIGLRKSWGGAITEASLNGVDYVNDDDPGRQIQVSLWDGNAKYDEAAGFWQWNPVEAGDHFYHGSPLLEASLAADSIYTRTQPIHWAPENISSGIGPLLGDAYIEKWVSVVPGHHRAFKVHYKITHFGTDAHANMLQELPVMYVNPNVPNIVYYAGDAPWTKGALLRYPMPATCCPYFPTPEQWGAYVDSGDVGIALYTPMQFPFSKGFNAGPTLQFTPACPYNWEPGSVLEFDSFILVGAVDEMRATIYELHGEQTGPGPLPPLGFLIVPQDGTTVSGTVEVAGWAWGLSGILGVEIFVDGIRAGAANYGLPTGYLLPGQPSDTDYRYLLDTTPLPNGVHAIVAKATDNAGHVATFQTMRVTIAN